MGFSFAFFAQLLDNYIGSRYNNYIGERYNGGQYKRKERVAEMESMALTEAVFYILLSLDQPMHGYGIMQNTERLSGGRVRLAAGTLYGAIHTLLKKGWIAALPGSGRKKEYQLTEEGRAAVRVELARLRELIANGEEITKEWEQ